MWFLKIINSITNVSIWNLKTPEMDMNYSSEFFFIYISFVPLKYLTVMANPLFNLTGSSKISDVLYIGTQINMEEKQDKIGVTME